MEERKKGIAGSVLKWIALLSMLIDHSAAVLIEEGRWYVAFSTYTDSIPGLWTDLAMRLIGRLAFPIFCFLLVEGYLHTRSRKRYFLRLLLFGLLSEIPFDLAFRHSVLEFGYQNVYFTLLLGMLSMVLWDWVTRGSFADCSVWRKLAALPAAAVPVGLAFLASTDYSGYGVLLILVLYLLRGRAVLRDLAAGAVVLGASPMEIGSWPALALFHFYNGERGRQPKYLFYLFYPVHLALLVLLRYALYRV